MRRVGRARHAVFAVVTTSRRERRQAHGKATNKASENHATISPLDPDTARNARAREVCDVAVMVLVVRVVGWLPVPATAPGDRRLIPALLAPGIIAVALDRLGAADGVVLFVLAAAALLPLAWLIGEATDQAAQYTGPGIGGLLNASFGNAPELIIALVAVSHGLPDIVRASLAGSIIGNLLVVLGFTLLVAPRGTLDRASAFASLGTVAVAVLFLLIPSVAASGGNPDRHSLAVLSLPVAVALLTVRIFVDRWSLRRHRRIQAAADPVQTGGWSLRFAVGVLALATLVTAFVTETLVGSIDAFATRPTCLNSSSPP